MLRTKFDGFRLAIVTIVDLDHAATRFIDYDTVRPAMVLIEIAGEAYDQ
jgi:hypothetical protein